MTGLDVEARMTLLKLTSSGSESVADLDLVIPAAAGGSRQKKKVRLKRRERKGGGGGGHRRLHHPELAPNDWCCVDLAGGCWRAHSGYTQAGGQHQHTHSGCGPRLLPSLGAGAVVVLVCVLAYLTSTLHTRVIVLETQLKNKIVEDEAKSIPDTISSLESRVQVLLSNQSSLVENVRSLQDKLSTTQVGLAALNKSVAGGAGGLQVRQSIADLDSKVSELTQGFETVNNRSSQNEANITQMVTEINRLKLNDIDFNNGAPRPSQATVDSSEVDQLRARLESQASKISDMKEEFMGKALNTSIGFKWLKQDVESLQGSVSQLRDDNVNVTSRVRSLQEMCETKIEGGLQSLKQLKNDLIRFDQKPSSKNVGLNGQSNNTLAVNATSGINTVSKESSNLEGDPMKS